MFLLRSLQKSGLAIKVSRACTSIYAVRQLRIEHLNKRTVLQLTGPATTDYLQSMITNDVKKVEECTSMYSMILNPAGRVLYDLILYKLSPTDFLVEYDASGADYLHRHLLRYRLRKEVKIQPLTHFKVWVLYRNYEDGVSFSNSESNDILQSLKKAQNLVQFAPDPRLNSLGFRVITTDELHADKSLIEAGMPLTYGNSYDILRYRLGVGEGVKDHPPGQCLPFDTNLDLLNGVSFTKGCYIGQEMTAKSNYVLSIRKRLMPVVLETRDTYPVFPPECSIVSEKQRKVGRFRSHLGRYGLALLKYEDCLKSQALSLEGCDINMEVVRPSWWPSHLSSDKNKHIFTA